jgi:hypothetical protein
MILKNILILTVIAALVPTAMSNVSASAASEIALFSSDSYSLSISGNGDNAKMELKATNENGKTKSVSDFQLTADNVLNIKTGDKVDVKDDAVFTKAITTHAGNNQKVIGITSDGVIDFTGYPQGVSTLDVVVDDDRAYEAIIVIGQQTKEVVDKEITRVNNKYVTDISFKTVLEFPDHDKGDKCSNKPGSAGMGYPMQKRTECELEEWDDCKKNRLSISGWGGNRCDNMHELFHDDDCLGFSSKEECDEAYNPKEPLQPEPIVGTCNDGATPINGICPRPDPNGDYCEALGCPGSPPNEPIGDELIPIEVLEPEPTDPCVIDPDSHGCPGNELDLSAEGIVSEVTEEEEETDESKDEVENQESEEESGGESEEESGGESEEESGGESEEESGGESEE